MPEAISNALTKNSNCRSESRLKMRRPNHAPSKAAGTKANNLPVELPLHGRCRPHQMDCDQRHRLHAEDERLIHAALARLVPSLQAAPDSDKGPGETGQPPGDAAEKAGADVRHPPQPERACRRAEQEIAAVDDEQASDHGAVGRAWEDAAGDRRRQARRESRRSERSSGSAIRSCARAWQR